MSQTPDDLLEVKFIRSEGVGMFHYPIRRHTSYDHHFTVNGVPVMMHSVFQQPPSREQVLQFWHREISIQANRL